MIKSESLSLLDYKGNRPHYIAFGAAFGNLDWLCCAGLVQFELFLQIKSLKMNLIASVVFESRHPRPVEVHRRVGSWYPIRTTREMRSA